MVSPVLLLRPREADAGAELHYSYLVAMERAQILLNVLDVTWSEIVADGGLVVDS